MKPEEIQKNIALYYSKLPPEAQIAFASMAWLETLQKISQKYTLSDEQIKTLGTETTLVLIGMIPLDEYEQVLKKELLLPKTSMDNLLVEINESIIKNIRPALVEAYEANIRSETEESEKIIQKLDERFEKLPDNIKEAIVEYDYYSVLYKIAQDYKLNVLKTGNLEELTTDVITGTLPAEKYTQNIKNSLKLSEEEAGKLVKDVNEKILRKIRERVIGKDDAKLDKFILTSKPDEIEMQKDDTKILMNAGIELVEKPELSTSKDVLAPNHLELTAGGLEKSGETPKAEVLQRLESVHPLLVDKMSKPAKVPTTKTEYSLGNLSKTADLAPDVIKGETPIVDPYRELPQ